MGAGHHARAARCLAGISRSALLLAAALAVLSWSSATAAAPRRAPAPSGKPAPRPKASSVKPAAVAPAPPPAESAGRSEVRLPAGAAPPAAAVIKTEEAEKGVRTYTFDAQEVEGRLRAPQILYFLRRVRAEFDPRPLGHRSFMLELSDTRRSPAL